MAIGRRLKALMRQSADDNAAYPAPPSPALSAVSFNANSNHSSNHHHHNNNSAITHPAYRPSTAVAMLPSHHDEPARPVTRHRPRLDRHGRPKPEVYRPGEVPPPKHRGPVDRRTVRMLEAWQFPPVNEEDEARRRKQHKRSRSMFTTITPSVSMVVQPLEVPRIRQPPSPPVSPRCPGVPLPPTPDAAVTSVDEVDPFALSFGRAAAANKRHVHHDEHAHQHRHHNHNHPEQLEAIERGHASSDSSDSGSNSDSNSDSDSDSDSDAGANHAEQHESPHDSGYEGDDVVERLPRGGAGDKMMMKRNKGKGYQIPWRRPAISEKATLGLSRALEAIELR